MNYLQALQFASKWVADNDKKPSDLQVDKMIDFLFSLEEPQLYEILDFFARIKEGNPNSYVPKINELSSLAGTLKDTPAKVRQLIGKEQDSFEKEISLIFAIKNLMANKEELENLYQDTSMAASVTLKSYCILLSTKIGLVLLR